MATRTCSQEVELHIPGKSVRVVERWLNFPYVQLKITRHRTSKLGDYKPINRGRQHIISVNGSLNKYAFLLTLVHEIAHMHNYQAYGNKVKPHGQEWKDEFRQLMTNFDMSSIFPKELLPKIENYLQNPKASSGSDVQLSLALRNYDRDHVHSVVLSEIVIDNQFTTGNGRTFIKGHKLRKRFKCKEVNTGRLYLFNPITEVTPVWLR